VLFLPLKASWRDSRQRIFSRVGTVISEYTDEDGVLIFHQAYKTGLERIVSKRLSAPPIGAVTGLDQGEEPRQLSVRGKQTW
jgi:hypothetical protein